MSKGSKTTNEPWKEAKPYMLGAANTLGGVYNSTAGNIQAGADQFGGLMQDELAKYKAGNPMITAAQGYNTDVLSGKYLGQGNPYLQQMIDSSNNDLINSTQASLGKMGLTGGSDYAKMIADRVSKNSLGMRYQDYANERGAMANAAGQTGALTAADAMRLQPAMSLFGTQMAPLNAASQYANSLGGLLGGYQTQNQKESTGSTIGNIASAALSAAALFSDARLKTDITRVGETHAGQPIYTYRYGGQGPFHMGVMAQETPAHALGPVIDGYMTVRYEEVR